MALFKKLLKNVGQVEAVKFVPRGASKGLGKGPLASVLEGATAMPVWALPLEVELGGAVMSDEGASDVAAAEAAAEVEVSGVGDEASVVDDVVAAFEVAESNS